MKQVSRPGRGRISSWLALLAAILLAWQVAQPAAAHAHARHQAMEICTGDGVRTILVEQPAAPADHASCDKCPTCLTAPALALTTPINVAAPAPIAAPTPVVEPQSLASLKRPPVRPPGQGPPASQNA